MSTFVTVGNATQSFPRMLETVVEKADRLPQPVIVQYGNNDFSSEKCQSVAFMDMELFSRQLTNATLIVMHAGAGSIIHAIQAGKVPVVVPRRAEYGEIIDNHQIEFARSLAAEGRVVILEDIKKLELSAKEALACQARLDQRPETQPRLVTLISERLSYYRENNY
jgi:UDP-N-acetylglucosamine transferase subunit ALG13